MENSMNTITTPLEVEHITLIVYVVDVDRAIRFYHDVLGFHIGLRKENWCEMHHQGTIVGLRGGKGQASGKTGLAIQVPNIQESTEQIARSGGTIVEKPRRRDNLGIHYGVVADTEGNEIMITQVIE